MEKLYVTEEKKKKKKRIYIFMDIYGSNIKTTSTMCK